MVTVVISERNELTRLGLKAALQTSEDIEVVGDYEDIDMMLSGLNSLEPDVVIMGGPKDIVERCRICLEVRTLHPTTKVLALTEKRKDDDLYEIILSGASGEILKTAGSAEMVRSVGVVACGGLNFDSEALVRLLGRIPRQRGNAQPAGIDELTHRERAMMVLVARGDTNEEIGRRLKLSKFTVRNNVSDIRSKFGLKSRAELAAFAVQHGFLDDSGQFEVDENDSD